MRRCRSHWAVLLCVASFASAQNASAEPNPTTVSAGNWRATARQGALQHWLSTVPGAERWLRATTTEQRQLEIAPGTFIELGSARSVSQTDDRVALPNPPRRLLLDRARGFTRWADARRLTGSSAAGAGQGVVIGVVDSGIDVLHPDLRNEEGSSRMSWWLDFGSDPLGFHPGLEEDYGCVSGTLRCGILGPEEIQRLVLGETLTDTDGDIVMAPRDVLGHGTHVASLALGNGRSNPRYTGIAPEATLIGARVATTSAQVEDVDVLLATRFVFERAEEMGVPAVVNLSLGGDLGNHDGSTQLEQALGAWVSDEHPGRAIVVAAGNSGTTRAARDPYPTPLGVHTQVHVPEGSNARVPILVPGSGTLRAAFYVWIRTEQGDDLSVSVEEGNGTPILEAQAKGSASSATNGSVDVSVVHHVASELGVSDTEQGIVVVVSGDLEGGSVFALVLRGQATADLWIQSEGALAPEAGSAGALFPAATRERTVTVPASSPDVIAVGAVLNRTSWPSFDDEVELLPFSPALQMDVGSVLYFSSAGPNARGIIKPDLVAPGGVVAAAMASDAAPTRAGRINTRSIFGLTPLCDSSGCARVDEHHAVTLGTSMAAPLVAGAIALLFEREATLSQRAARDLLRTGARFLPGEEAQVGAGALDVRAAFVALGLEARTMGATTPSRKRSWLSFGESFARPGSGTPLRALVHLRDEKGDPLWDDPDALRVDIENGTLLNPTERIGAGLYELTLAADAESGGKRLRVRVHHEAEGDAILIAERSLPIAVDPNVAEAFVSVRGGCAVGRFHVGAYPHIPLVSAILVLLSSLALRTTSRRCGARKREAPRARGRGRRDTPGPRRRD